MMPRKSSILEPEVSAQPETVQHSIFRWAVLAASCLTVIAFQISAMSCAPLLGEIARGLGVGLAQAVTVMTVFMLFAALSFFPAGVLSRRMGAPALLIISATLSAVATTALLGLGGAYGTLLVARAMQGCAVGFAMAGMAPLVLQWFPPEQRGLALGIPGACNPVGVAIAVLVSPVLFRAMGSWQHALALMSVVGWFALLYCIVVFRIAKSRMPQGSAHAEPLSSPTAFSAALRQPYTWLGVVITFAVNWIMQCAFSLSPSYFAEPRPIGLDMGPVVAGQMMGVVQLGAIIGPIVGGLLLDKFFRGRARVVLILAFVLALSYCGLQSQFVCGTRPAFMVVLLLSGAGIGMLFPMVQSRISELYEHGLVGPMNGLWLGIGAFGGSAGLFVTSLALKQTGGYTLPINIISAAAALGLILCAIRSKSAKSA
jgi:MFS family permease